MKDATITEEVLVVLEVIEIQAENEEVLVVEVLDQEKKVVEVLETPATQLQEKAVSEVIEMLHQEKVVLFQKVLEQKENQVQHKEKKKHQDDLKVQVINQLVVPLKLLKAEDQERVKA